MTTHLQHLDELMNSMPDGVVSYWPEGGDWDTYDDDDWIVGIAIQDFGKRESSYPINKDDDCPSCYREIFKTDNKKFAVAFVTMVRYWQENKT